MTGYGVADRLISIFPTTILHRRLEGMEETNRQLQALIDHIAATEANSTAGTTTEGGFQTKDDLFQRRQWLAALPLMRGIGWGLVLATQARTAGMISGARRAISFFVIPGRTRGW